MQPPPALENERPPKKVDTQPSDGWVEAVLREDITRFTLRDRKGTASVPVAYRGTVPDLFKVGREVVVDGKLVNGTFQGIDGTLVTKCPSKYAPVKKSS